MSHDFAASKAQDLRTAFDRSFAQAPRDALARAENLLAIRLGEDPYAIRLSHLAGLFAGKAVTGLPNTNPAFLGVAGFRGALVPVYDLRVLLGYPGGETPRWLVIASANRVALAFDALDGLLRVPHESVAGQEHGEAARPHVRELVRAASSAAPRPLIDLYSVVASIEQRTRQPLPNSSPERRT